MSTWRVVSVGVLAAACSRSAPEAEPVAVGSGGAPARPSEAAPSAVVAEAVARPSAVPSSVAAVSSPKTRSPPPPPFPPVPVAASVASVPPPTASAALAPRVAPRRGPVATGEGYETWLETTGGYASGQPAFAVVVVQAKAPFKCNAEYPHKLALDPPPSGLTFPSPVVRGMKVDGKRGTMAVPFAAERAGSAAVAGMLSFSVCTADRCLMEKARVSVPIEIR